MKGPLLAVLLVFLTIALLIVEKLAHQRDDHAVAKTQACLKHIDIILVVLLLFTVRIDRPSGFTLQQVFIPKDGEGNLLAAINGDGIAVVDQIALELLAADQSVDQLDMRLLDLADINLTQESK